MARTYEYLIEGHWVRGCDSCGAKAPLGKFGGRGKRERCLCKLCAESFVGNATKHSDRYDDVNLFKVVAQIGNLILDEITGREPTEDK